MEISKATMKKLILLILFAALAFSFFEWIDGVAKAATFLVNLLSPFLIGSAIAFVLNVPMRFLETKLFTPQSHRKGARPMPQKLKRILSLLLTVLLVLAVLALVVLVVIPQLAVSVSGLGATIQNAFTRFIAWMDKLLINNPQLLVWFNDLAIDWQSIDWEGILSSVASFLKNGAGNVLSSTFSVVKNLVGGVGTAVIAFIFACYILLQKEKLALQFKKALYAIAPKKAADHVVRVCAMSQRIFSSFITGQVTEAVILGAMFVLAMTILRMPYALLVGCLIAVTALIPIVGAFIGCAVGAFLLLMISPSKALIFVIMFLILQQIEGNLIYPHVVGSSVGLPSIWVLAAVTVGGSLMGVAGMLIFIPLVSVAYALFREFVYKRLKEKDIRME